MNQFVSQLEVGTFSWLMLGDTVVVTTKINCFLFLDSNQQLESCLHLLCDSIFDPFSEAL